jgi:hypothetical protein
MGKIFNRKNLNYFVWTSLTPAGKFATGVGGTGGAP